MSPPIRQPSRPDWRRDDSEPPAGEPSLSAVHVDVEKLKYRIKQLEVDVSSLETDIARLDGEHTDSKVKAVRVEDFISREQAARNEWRATVRGILGAVTGTIILGALAMIGKLLWEELKK